MFTPAMKVSVRKGLGQMLDAWEEAAYAWLRRSCSKLAEIWACMSVTSTPRISATRVASSRTIVGLTSG